MRYYIFLFFTLFAVNDAICQQRLSDWKTLFTTIEEKEFLGEKAFHMGKGLAYLPACHFADGIVEVDIAPVNPGLAGICFHIDDSFSYNEIYIRFAKSGGPDAVQYSPEFNGELSWQFYPEYQGTVVYPSDKWIHLKIEIKNTRAAAYVLNKDSAVLLVDSLRVPIEPGRLGFWSLGDTYFKNFYYSAKNSPDFPEKFPDRIIHNEDAIKNWKVSPSYEFNDTSGITLPVNLSSTSWKNALTEPDGFLNINKYARKKIWGKTRDNSNDVVWLKHEWNEASGGLKAFSFEYSNRCLIFCNGQRMFSGNNSFLLKGPLFRGDVDKQLRANCIYLPVQKGKNLLMIAVSSVTNGWGFMAQFADGSSKKSKAF